MPEGDGKDGKGLPCKTCKGKGKTHTIINGGRGLWERECPTCKGTGKEKSCQQE